MLEWFKALGHAIPDFCEDHPNIAAVLFMLCMIGFAAGMVSFPEILIFILLGIGGLVLISVILFSIVSIFKRMRDYIEDNRR